MPYRLHSDKFLPIKEKSNHKVAVLYLKLLNIPKHPLLNQQYIFQIIHLDLIFSYETYQKIFYFVHIMDLNGINQHIPKRTFVQIKKNKRKI